MLLLSQSQLHILTPKFVKLLRLSSLLLSNHVFIKEDRRTFSLKEGIEAIDTHQLS